MKKLCLAIILGCIVSAPVLAEPNHEEHRWHGERHEGHGNNALAFIGGILLGSIVAHEIDGHYYDEANREVVRVRVCSDLQEYDGYGRPLYDYYGRPYMRRECHDEWHPAIIPPPVLPTPAPQG